MNYENKPQTEKARDKDEFKKDDIIMTFCDACEDYVEARVFESVSDVYDFGKRASFNRLDLICTRCGRYISSDEIDEINNKRQSIIE